MAHSFDHEDLSTLGVDDDSDESIGSKEDNGFAEDEVLADQERYNKENELIVDGFRCPDEYLKMLTPMEFEEIVSLFIKFDVDGSGRIDKHETKKILLFLGIETTIKVAEELLEVIDADKNGEIDFNEFCTFIVLMKRGDPRLMRFHSMLNKLSTTPLGELERQARSRNLKITFKLAQRRVGSLTNPTTYIIELQLTGVFHTVSSTGEVIAEPLLRRFQGMGATTKEAKYNAATNALINLGETMPGKYDYD